MDLGSEHTCSICKNCSIRSKPDSEWPDTQKNETILKPFSHLPENKKVAIQKASSESELIGNATNN